MSQHVEQQKTTIPPDKALKVALSNIRLERIKKQYGETLKAPKYEDHWPPDYEKIWAWRDLQKARFVNNEKLVKQAKAYYADNPAAFINHWIVLHEPRNAESDKPTKMPLILFPKQDELINFLMDCLKAESPGLVEKARDMGATWVCASFSIWLWLFKPGAVVGWGSRTVDDIDKIGDPNTIFEKIRAAIHLLPDIFLPIGFKPKDHMPYMRIINPENGATIIGEGGPHVGRGGRSLIYFVDEAAHLEYPEKVESALSDTTRVRVDLSSVSGLGTVFHRKREAGKEWVKGEPVAKDRTNVFIMDWSDHPEKTREWYLRRRKLASDAGQLHNFAREVERDYAASVEGVIILPEWVDAALEIADKLDVPDFSDYEAMAGLDVADSVKGDRNALAVRHGPVLNDLQEWGERDTGVTCRRAISACKGYTPIRIQYDSKGIGAGVKAESNRLKDEGLLSDEIRLVAWDSGKPVQNPLGRVVEGDNDSARNREFFGNLKAQAWWALRRRFEKTWRALNDPEFTYEFHELIVLPKDHPLINQLRKELSQPTTKQDSRLRMFIDKMAQGMKSPNLADALVMAYFKLEMRRFQARAALIAPKILEG